VHRVGVAAAESTGAEAVTTIEVTPEVAAEATLVKKEASLYEPFHLAIVNGYTKENRIKRFISEVTAQQGRRTTGGKWTRPDVTVVAVRTYQFTPGKRIEVITFEVSRTSTARWRESTRRLRILRSLTEAISQGT
jgi:hypothetical protein